MARPAAYVAAGPQVLCEGVACGELLTSTPVGVEVSTVAVSCR
jgi:hypothetical protein